MALIPLLAMVRKDLRVFFSERRSVIVSFVVPIVIASFFGALFTGSSQDSRPAKIGIAIVDQDGSAISKAIVSSAQADANLAVTMPSAGAAHDAVRRGKTSVAITIPKGFGDAAGKAFFSAAQKPELAFAYDPSRRIELAMVRGILTQHVMQAVSAEVFGGGQGRRILDQTLSEVRSSSMADEDKRALVQMMTAVQTFYDRPSTTGGGTATGPRGITMPYDVREEAVTAGANAPYNGYAHSFGGMAIQFLLFAMANLGIELLVERERGLWRRVRSAPVSKLTLLTGKAASGTLISLMILLVSFAFAIVAFRVRIHGSVVGFFSVSIACALMASTFGLLVAALGNSPATARGVTTLAVLMMVMLGGAWVPTFIFPAWLQQVTLIVPVRWAVDGLDAMTWRGIGISGAVVPTAVLLAFSAVFAALALTRFRWEEA
ncbi:MAG TPA: ABC transporter permease [Vicinamibacterales bacterium]|jgi:ABC-2 type transport system permease protein|nr:ABC transporter permease [Vicinamibacterales bacterium]